MTFFAAGWLVLLVPWAALVAWVWRRVADERATTAAFLWASQSVDPPHQRSRRGRPPLWIIATLFAVLASILALSQPAYRGRRANVVVLFDRFVSLAARTSDRRTDEMLSERVTRAIDACGVGVSLDARVIASESRSVGSVAAALNSRFTARSTESAMATAVNDAESTSDAVIVLTDAAVSPRSDRVAVLAPEHLAGNAGIESAVAVDRPRPSLMVRIANGTNADYGTLRVRTSDAPEVVQPIKLPRTGTSGNVFVDLPTPADAIEISLADVGDAIAIDNSAALLRDHETPSIVVDTGAPPIALRFAAAYERSQKGSEHATKSHEAIHFRSVAEPTESTKQIVLAEADSAVGGELHIAEHPILRDIDLAAVNIDSRSTAPPGGWRVIATLGESPILAVRESPERGVWVGFRLNNSDPRSVLLLANAVDWLAESSPTEWHGQTPDAIGNDWRATRLVDDALISSPGLYVDGGGRAVAINVPAIRDRHGRSHGEIAALLQRADRQTFVPIGGWLSIVAAALAGLAAILSARRRVAGRVP